MTSQRAASQGLVQLALVACLRTVTDPAIVEAERESAVAGSVRR